MNKTELLDDLLQELSIDIDFIIRESFLGYKWRKQSGNLYNSDLSIPKKLIEMYYTLEKAEINFDVVKKAFINKYIKNESAIEGINNKISHSIAEIKGLEIMYEYIHSQEIEYMFNVYTLKELHQKLFSLTPYPEAGGNFRTIDVYLPGTGSELSEWSMVRDNLNDLDVEVQALVEMSKVVKEGKEIDLFFQYIERTIKLKCDLIKVHPFYDGNGRTIRGFVNKLFEMAGLPPVYVKENERKEYIDAMYVANNLGNYEAIQNFYLYKICDSIIELDINERVKEQREEAKIEKANQKIKNYKN